MSIEHLADIRINYQKNALDWHQLDKNPYTSLQNWLTEALHYPTQEPSAMMLATCDAQQQPHARVVLLKGIDEGLIFYTHYEGAKGQDLAHNPKAACTFFWPEMERQLRIEGVVTPIDPAQSDAYFASRPIDSQLGACASPQSQVIADRSVLEDNFNRLTTEFAQQPITRPANWGGYRLTAHLFEFWQGRPNRLHDRLRYRLDERNTDGEAQWITERLAP